MRLLILCVLLALPVAAEPGHAYVTELGRRVLARTDQVVLAKVEKIQPPFRGISTARLSVAERLAGYDRETSIVLLYVEDYLAPDAFTSTLDTATVRYEHERQAGLDKYLKDLASLKLPKAEDKITNAKQVESGREQAPSPGRGVSGVRLAEGEEGIFFLHRQSTSYALVGIVPQRDPLYDSKLARLRDVIALEKIPAIDRRADNAKQLFLDGLSSDDVWLRANSAREIASLATRYHDLFTEDDAKRLATLLVTEKDPEIRSSIERAAGAVDRRLAVQYAREAEDKGLARNADSLRKEKDLLDATRMPELKATDLMRVARTYGRAATQLLGSYLADPDAIVREYAANGLAEQGTSSADGALRDALAKERDPDAAMAMLYALGTHADPDAVAVVAARLKEPALERAAVHALARIGTDEARTALEAHAKEASAETQDLIASLIREEFAERR
jgi:hypothetical protein